MTSRNLTPTSASYYLGPTPSSMMTPGHNPRRGSHDQLRRIIKGGAHTSSQSIFRQHPPSSDTLEKSESTTSIHAHRRHLVSPVSKKTFGDLSIALMTPRKGYNSVSKETARASEESPDAAFLAEGLKQKTMENEALRTEIFRLESELRNVKRNLKTVTEQNEDNFATAELSDKQVKDILNSVNELIARSEEAQASIVKKCAKLEELILYIESGVLSTYQGLELRALTDKLKHMIEEFQSASQLEIELGTKSRELVKKKLDFVYLNTRYEKMTTRCEGLQHDLNILRQTLKAGHTEKNIFVRNLTKEKTLNRETQKKLGNLQKTLEILTEGQQSKQAQQSDGEYSNLGIPVRETPYKGFEGQHTVGEEKELNTTKLREALSKLVKENEALRRVIHVRDKEIEKLTDNLSKTVWKLNKASLRIDKLRNHKTGHKMNDGTQDEEDLLVFYSSKKTIDIMNPAWDSLEAYRGIPKNLDFRFGLFEERYVDLINDVLEGGSQAFAEHVRMLTSDEELKEEVTLISNQFVSYRNFAEKMNRLMSECFSLFSLKTFNEVMVHISTHMKPIMGAGTVRVWIPEPMTGTYRSMEAPDRELKCLVNKGLIAEVIKSSTRILKRSQEHKYQIMETINHNGISGAVKARTCLLVPLKGNDDKIIGVLEVSKFSYETFLLDLDYFAQMLAELCVVLWNRTSRERILLNDLKMKEMYFDAFSDLAISLSQKEFSEKVEDWVSKIFQSSCTRYVIVDNSELIRFSKDSSPRILNGSTGIIGRVATTRKPFIVLEASGSSVHSENVDINTTFPLYTTPVIMKHRWNDPSTEDKNMIIGVLQIVMNQKSVVRENGTDENLTNHVKTIDPSTENLISKFTKLMAIAYDVMAKRTNKEEPVAPVVQPPKKKVILR